MAIPDKSGNRFAFGEQDYCDTFEHHDQRTCSKGLPVTLSARH